MESTLRRTWAEIDLDALAHNYRTLRDRVGPEVKFLGVVKADAYGHGAVQVSRILQALGADYLAVSSIDEATELRCNGITMPILILGHTPREQVGRLIDLHITQAVSCQAKALEYSEEAVRCGGELTVHIKVDTGMSRLGYLVSGRHFDPGTADICAACALPGLRAEGIFTHFAVSDEPDADSRAYTEKQLALFRRVIDAVEAKRGQRFAIRHCANSGGVASYPETPAYRSVPPASCHLPEIPPGLFRQYLLSHLKGPAKDVLYQYSPVQSQWQLPLPESELSEPVS